MLVFQAQNVNGTGQGKTARVRKRLPKKVNRTERVRGKRKGLRVRVVDRTGGMRCSAFSKSEATDGMAGRGDYYG